MVLPPPDAVSVPSFHWLQAVLGLASPESNAERPIIPTSPAAAYPPRYAGLRVQLLSCSAHACTQLNGLIVEAEQSTEGSSASSHLLSSHSQVPPAVLTTNSPGPLIQFIQRCLDAHVAGASDGGSAAFPNVLLVHIDEAALSLSSSDDSNLFLPPLLDQAVEQLHSLLYTKASLYSDVYLAVLRLQSTPHLPSLPSSSPLLSLIPRQSYKLAIPTASSTPSYLPLLSFHPNTTRSDRSLHPDPPTAFSLGSGGLIAARDWLAELAFKLGGKAKYGA